MVERSKRLRAERLKCFQCMRASVLLRVASRPHRDSAQYAYVGVRARWFCRPESRTRRAPARGAQPDECLAAPGQAGPCRDARCTWLSVACVNDESRQLAVLAKTVECFECLVGGLRSRWRCAFSLVPCREAPEGKTRYVRVGRSNADCAMLRRCRRAR